MDIQTISKRTQLSLRKLRYVLDHRLLPGTRVQLAVNAAGQPRQFTEFEGFAIAAAAALLDGGLKRDSVIRFFSALADFSWDVFRGKPQNALLNVFSSADVPALCQFADDTNIRVVLAQRDSGWVQPHTNAKLDANYRPRVTVELDLARLRDELKEIRPRGH
jgi:hypothetical protein